MVASDLAAFEDLTAEAGSECEDAMSEPTGGTTGYPNARLRLRRTTHAPNAPDTDAALMLWLSGSRFRLRDEAGRSYPAILADVAPGRGLGAAARSIEDQMDAWSEAGRFWPPTEIYADLTADRATVVESGGQPWSIAAQRLAGLADQVFSHALAAGRRTGQPDQPSRPPRATSSASPSWARRTASPTGARCGGG